MQITIFTPTYNRAYILPRLFQSLKNQKATNFEWLIVDDGSSDDTESVVNEFIKDADFNIRYYKQNNQGKHIALNFAALNAEGEWIITIDSDDFVEIDSEDEDYIKALGELNDEDIDEFLNDFLE